MGGDRDIQTLLQVLHEAAQRAKPPRAPREGHAWELKIEVHTEGERVWLEGRWVEVPRVV